jgi:hypothetical protein
MLKLITDLLTAGAACQNTFYFDIWPFLDMLYNISFSVFFFKFFWAPDFLGFCMEWPISQVKVFEEAANMANRRGWASAQLPQSGMGPSAPPAAQPHPAEYDKPWR